MTTVAETIVDLAAELTADELARAFHQAGIRHHTTPAQVEAVLARRPQAAGRAPCAGSSTATSTSPSAHSRNASSPCCAPTACRSPRPTSPPAAAASTAAGPAHRLTVELDGYRYHRSRHAWENDRHRERQAHARGDHHRRYTYNDVLEDPALMLAELARLLRLRP